MKVQPNKRLPTDTTLYIHWYPFSRAKFVAKHTFQFRLLSDTTRGFAVAVGAADSTSRLWARRISYLVGADGKVLKAYDNVSPGTHATQVLADLAAWKK